MHIAKNLKRARIYAQSRGLTWATLFLIRQIGLKYIDVLKKYGIHTIEQCMMYAEKRNRLARKGSEWEAITFIEFLKIAEQDTYYTDDRWAYMEYVIDIVSRESPHSILELGPYKMPVIKGSDVMDKLRLPRLTYQHDATQFPWPIENAKYDLFIALQVFEHLANKQTLAFKEVMRISKMAILSFPYKWKGYSNVHNDIDEMKIAEWTLHVRPEKTFKVPGYNGDRIVYFFRF